jgi:hypothetical protein
MGFTHRRRPALGASNGDACRGNEAQKSWHSKNRSLLGWPESSKRSESADGSTTLESIEAAGRRMWAEILAIGEQRKRGLAARIA